MKIYTGTATIKNDYIFKADYDLDNLMFFDIETTGLSRDKCRIYLIGALYFENKNPRFIQWLSDTPCDEKDILFSFASFAIGYNTIIHFNGNAFDMPFVCERCRKHNINFDFEKFQTIDLYKNIQPFKHILKLDSIKQKSIESFIGINRQDIFSGGDLIHLYREFLQSKDERLEKILLLHNYEDVNNMAELVSINAYNKLFFDKIFSVCKSEIHEYVSFDNEFCRELIIEIYAEQPLPSDISYAIDDFYISGAGHTVKLRSKITDNKVKLFHADYNNYYYLPVEDIAIHKSIAKYVDKNFRQKATALNCYTKININDKLTRHKTFLKRYSDNILDTLLLLK